VTKTRHSRGKLQKAIIVEKRRERLTMQKKGREEEAKNNWVVGLLEQILK